MSETLTAGTAEESWRTAKRRRGPKNAPAEELPGEDALPPHSEEAERGLLGCVLLSPMEVLPTLIEQRVAALWFYSLVHQHLFSVMRAMYEAEPPKPVDATTLVMQLKELGLLEQVGGMEYVSGLQEAAPSAANWSHYRDTVRDKWRLRQVLDFAVVLKNEAQTWTGSVEAFLAEKEAQLSAVVEPITEKKERTIKQVIKEKVMDKIERHYNRGSTQLDGLPTGLDYLDKILLGLEPTDYVVLAGRPGEGKTSLVLNIVDHLATRYVHWDEVPLAEVEKLRAAGEAVSTPEDGKAYVKRVGVPVGVFTLEMTEDSLAFRLVFSHAKISSGAFRQGFASEADHTALNKAVGELCHANIYLDGEADQSMDTIAAKARRWAKQYGIKLFVLDYVQLLDSDDDTDRLRVLRRISKKIVSLKKRLQVPWLVIAMMNRNIETAERARRPVLSDLKESGSIEQDADKIVFLYHPLKGEKIEDDELKIDAVLKAKYGEEVPKDAIPRRINALVAKNRNGPTGPAQLLFQNNQCLFHDWRRWQIEHRVVDPAAGERGAPKIDPADMPPPQKG